LHWSIEKLLGDIIDLVSAEDGLVVARRNEALRKSQGGDTNLSFVSDEFILLTGVQLGVLLQFIDGDSRDEINRPCDLSLDESASYNES
jgi:hypothetical protein